MNERMVRRVGASALVLGLLVSLLGLGVLAPPAAAVEDTSGLVCNNQKDRPDQDCEGDNAHGTVKAAIDPATGDLTFDIAATGKFIGTGWRQIYICIPGTPKTKSADCQGNTATVLDPRPQPGGAYDVSVPATNTENTKDVTFACSDTIKATVDAAALPTGSSFGWTIHVNTCDGGTDEAFGTVRRTPPAGDEATYECVTPTGVTDTAATLRGATNDGDVTRAVFSFTAPSSETRTFTDDTPADGFRAAVTGLTANTAHRYKVDFFAGSGQEAVGQAAGCSFTTSSTPDTYACTAPEDVTADSATLLGSTSNGEVDAATFTLTPATGTATAVEGAERGNSNTWSGAAKDLLPDTRYTYTVAFKDGADVAGTGSGDACAFTTKAASVLADTTQRPAPAAESPASVAPTGVAAVASNAAVAPTAAAPATLPRTGVATDILLPMGLALVLAGLAALTLGGRREPLVVLGRPDGHHYRDA